MKEMIVKKSRKNIEKDIKKHERFREILKKKENFTTGISKKFYQDAVHLDEISKLELKLKVLDLEFKIAVLEKRWNDLFRLEALHEYLRKTGWEFVTRDKNSVVIKKDFNDGNGEIDFLIPNSMEAPDYNYRIDDFFKRAMITVVEGRSWEKILDDVLEIDANIPRPVEGECKRCGKAGKEYHVARIKEGTTGDENPLSFYRFTCAFCNDCIVDVERDHPENLYLMTGTKMPEELEKAVEQSNEILPPDVNVYPDEWDVQKHFEDMVVDPLRFKWYKSLVEEKKNRKRVEISVLTGVPPCKANNGDQGKRS
jgi:hypothetical protein